MKKLIELFSKNFWVRNIALAACFIVLEQVFRPDEGLKNILIGAMITVALYSWLVVHNRILVEKMLLKKRYFIYFIFLLVGVVYYSVVMYSNSKDGYALNTLSRGMSIAFFNTLAATLFYFAYKYLMEQQAFAQNKLLMFEMEQNYLKNQLSPHFLFNTLNNIYSYSLVESKKTPELILKLSELMRYLIQFNKKNEILLKEEMEFIENYLAFERERLEDRCAITFTSTIPDNEIKIEPLLFFPLVENAFKHGTNTMDYCFVKINVMMKKNILRVAIENKIVKHLKPSTHSGIENVKKRLQLFYPSKHNLQMTERNGNYFVDLEIELHT